MIKKSQLPLIIIGLLAIIGLSFLAGAFFYRSGMLSEFKTLLIPQATQTPLLPEPEVQIEFDFEFLEDPNTATMNSVPLVDNLEPLRFMVAGHIYGAPGDEEFHPSPTFINHVSTLRDLDPDFMVLLGDTVWKPKEDNFDILDLLVLEPLQVPIYNAVGNHDVTKRDIYQARYGNTAYAFKFKDQLFLFLDTTLKYYDLDAEQLAFVQNTIEDQMQSSDPLAIHIFMHHVLFLEEDEVYGKQLLKPNEGDGVSESFQVFLESTLYPISQTTPIYIYAGDVGAFKPGNLSPLYKRSPDHNVTFLATGLGNHQNDSILIIEEHAHEGISIKPYSLTGKAVKSIETYDFDYWLSK